MGTLRPHNYHLSPTETHNVVDVPQRIIVKARAVGVALWRRNEPLHGGHPQWYNITYCCQVSPGV